MPPTGIPYEFIIARRGESSLTMFKVHCCNSEIEHVGPPAPPEVSPTAGCGRVIRAVQSRRACNRCLFSTGTLATVRGSLWSGHYPLESLPEVLEALVTNPVHAVLGDPSFELRIRVVLEDVITHVHRAEIALIVVPVRPIRGPLPEDECRALEVSHLAHEPPVAHVSHGPILSLGCPRTRIPDRRFAAQGK